MNLTFAEDFSTSSVLDSELMGTPDSGLYWNRGVLPVVNVNNLLAILPNIDISFSAYDAGATYGKFSDTRSKNDIVTSGGKIYQSLASGNTGNLVTDTAYWLETNLDSLRVKSFLWKSEDNLIAALSIRRKLIESQYIYNIGDTDVDLPNDYCGWAFEPKNSDYVKIRINQIGLQANTTDPVNLYVINQGTLVATIELNPNNGILSFESKTYEISGVGVFYFVIDSQSVKSGSSYNNPLKYSGFVCYPVSGIGATPQAADYSESFYGNGLSFNVSAYLDSSQYVTNNLVDFAGALQAQFEIDFINALRFNANARTNIVERIIGMDKELLDFHATDTRNNTVAKKYNREIDAIRNSINITYDRFLRSSKKLTIYRSSI